MGPRGLELVVRALQVRLAGKWKEKAFGVGCMKEVERKMRGERRV